VSESLPLREPFHDAAQQREAAYMGLYIFLGTEIMLFGGLFAGVLTYRVLYPSEVAEAARHLNLRLGAVNTAVLLTSSLAVALAIDAARSGRTRSTLRRLAAAVLLGLVFLAIKGVEYSKEYAEGLMPGIGPAFPLPHSGQELFLNLYFVATGLHALHLSIGIAALVLLCCGLWTKSVRLPERTIAIELIGLYWHFVDVVWVFLYPVLYLAR
jgi:cytochrome c oxidase subunit 3